MEILHPGYQPLCLQYGDDFSREPDSTVSPDGRYGVWRGARVDEGPNRRMMLILQDQHTGSVSPLCMASVDFCVVWSGDSSRVAVLGQTEDDDECWFVFRVVHPSSDIDDPATKLVYCMRVSQHFKKVVFDPTLLRCVVVIVDPDRAGCRMEIYNLHTPEVSVGFPEQTEMRYVEAGRSTLYRIAFAWTPCGKQLAIACFAGSPCQAIVWIVDAKTGRVVCSSVMDRIYAPFQFNLTLNVSPDGKLLVFHVARDLCYWVSVWRIPVFCEGCYHNIEPDRYDGCIGNMRIPDPPMQHCRSVATAEKLLPLASPHDPAIPRLKLELSMVVRISNTILRRVSWRCPGVLVFPVKDINKSFTVAITSDPSVSIMSHISRNPHFLAYLGPHVCSIVRLMLWICVYRDRGSLQPWLSRLPTELFHHILSYMLCLPRCVMRARLLR